MSAEANNGGVGGGPGAGRAAAWWPSALAAGAVLALLVCLYAGGQFIRKDYALTLLWLVPPSVLAAWHARRTALPARHDWRRHLPLLVLAGGLALLLVASVSRHKWFYFLRWTVDTTSPLRSLFVFWVFGTALLIPVLLRWRRAAPRLALAVFIGSQALAALALLATTRGAAIYRTDHPSFMFRLWEFSRTFPQLVNYNPYWNAGTVGCVEVTSGTLGPGLLLWPLWRLIPVHAVYTTGLALIFIGIVPWAAYGSIRAMGGDRTAGAVGGTLALGVSQHYFLWMLHFGTIGAALASSMVIPVSALAFRVVCQGRTGWRTGLALVAASSSLLFWPPCGLAGVGVALATLLHARRWTRRRLAFLAACGLALAVLYAPVVRVLLTEGKKTLDFVMTGGASDAASAAWLTRKAALAGWKLLIAHLQEGHPVLLVLGLCGALVVRPRAVGRWYLPVFVLLILGTGWAEQWKPNSQLARLSIPLFFAAVVPAAFVVRRLLTLDIPALAPVRAGLLALLAAGGLNLALVYANLGLAPYVVMSKEMDRLVRWVRNDVPEGGRVMFAGRCVHAYGRGNVAYLPGLTGREMMADDYYGFPIGTIEYEYPPPAFRKPIGKFQLFCDTYNITHVLTYHDKWKEFFRQYPEYFEETFSVPSAHLTICGYALKRTPRALHAGEGRVRATFNRLDVMLEGAAQAEVVLPYNWTRGLRASEGVELFPQPVSDGIVLIGARPGGKTAFTVRFR